MPKLRKRRKRPTNIEEHPDASPTLPTSIASGPRSRTEHKAQYRHYAANVRLSGNCRTQDKLSGTSKTPSTNVVISVLMLSVLICLGSMPDVTLRMLLLGEMLFCTFPPFFANWTISIAILLPMKLQSRTEVVLGLATFSWISNLEWAYAWERVTQKIVMVKARTWTRCGRKVNRENYVELVSS